MDSPKGPSAVVLAVRDGRVLALTRGSDFADWHLPGGKVGDGETLKQAASRELKEETGLHYRAEDMRELCSFTSRTGRPVTAFIVCVRAPVPMKTTRAGHPAWVPAAMLVQPWCSFDNECRTIFAAAGIDPDCDDGSRAVEVQKRMAHRMVVLGSGLPLIARERLMLRVLAEELAGIRILTGAS